VRARLVIAVSLVVLALPAQAAAHGRSATIALDYRLELDPLSMRAAGVSVRILDGDRSLEVSSSSGMQVLVRGSLGEPMLRISGAGVWVNASSPTALGDGLVPSGERGWVRVSRDASYAWHDHRLKPPPASRPGPAGRFSVPVEIDGRKAAIAGTFWRVSPPAAWPWLAGAAAFAAAVAAAAAFRRGWRSYLTVGLGTGAGLGALVAVTTFAARDAPNGRVAWLQIGAGILVGAVLAAVLVGLRDRRRVHAAGVVGAIAAAASLGSLPVFWHGVVISALPATPTRLACGLALVGGLAAAAMSFLPDFDELPRVRR
jgi:hypothetical protein